ncbi:uncharacterized protein RCC_04982 [Ramularia collo-cygni]|uniref:Uncharacterized protein n=1 Tax=Ramularia collo-cygni TaxID=112498 RepID=A0A2D3V6H1_9PEZI|nr:uncharacterized protein RCC_04982 [Ramularia collo-cygni]CZT19136.1 uncharacterized protein RCC_04982 [Ramularia collo-cygni]
MENTELNLPRWTQHVRMCAGKQQIIQAPSHNKSRPVREDRNTNDCLSHTTRAPHFKTKRPFNMTDPRIHEDMRIGISKLAIQIAAHEEYHEKLTVEIARREENDGEVEEEKLEMARVEAQLRTMRLLKGAKEVEMQLGKSAAGAFLGENIGK